jgi:hypothetical protein
LGRTLSAFEKGEELSAVSHIVTAIQSQSERKVTESPNSDIPLKKPKSSDLSNETPELFQIHQFIGTTVCPFFQLNTFPKSRESGGETKLFGPSETLKKFRPLISTVFPCKAVKNWEKITNGTDQKENRNEIQILLKESAFYDRLDNKNVQSFFTVKKSANDHFYQIYVSNLQYLHK